MEKKQIKELVKKKKKVATAVHGTDGTNHFVGIGNIRVIICPDGDSWFAQGLEIDYAANGRSVEEVKKNFEEGLAGTIDLHIKMYSNIEHFLKVAPQDVWGELHRGGRHFHYSQVSLHEDLSQTLGYQKIDYLEPSGEAVA